MELRREDYAKRYLEDRQKCRTDLFFLCNEILARGSGQSRIMVPHAHGPIVDHCQKFHGYEEFIDPATMHIRKAIPLCAMEDLEGPRDNLLLVSRGHLKTTIHTVGHIIQWILNYPNVRILITTATDEKAQLIMAKIKQHFQFNRIFRHLFPEFCPGKRVSDWGSKTEIIVPNATRHDEPTIMTAAVGKALASTHHDVIKCSDVVTENNVKTKGQIQEVIDFFGYMEPLRERFESKNGKSNVAWLDVEGTIYDFADFYQMVLDNEAKLPPEQRQWNITKRSCWVDKAKRISLWPERFPPAELDRILRSPQVGPYIFSAQYELNPVAQGQGLATREDIRYFDHRLVPQLMPRYQRVDTTIDLSTMDGTNTKGDFVSMLTAGVDADARLDVFAIQHGRFTDEQVIDLMFLIQQIYPKNNEFRIQKDQLVGGGFKTLLRREMTKRKIWLNVKYVPIPTNENKNHRILRQLQGWFSLGLIRFSDGIPMTTRLALEDEILRFPRGANDDIIDTLADQMHDEHGDASGVLPREKTPAEHMAAVGGFDPFMLESEPDMNAHYAEMTGL